MMNEIDDKNNSLAFLRLLLNGKIAKDDLLKELEIKDSTFYKHLQLMRDIGFHINRVEDIYELYFFENKINFAPYELSLFSYLFLLAYIMLPKKKTISLTKMLEKVLYLSNKKDFEIVKEKYEYYRKSAVYGHYRDKILTFKKYLDKKLMAIFYLKNGTKIKAIPKEFTWGKNDKIYLICETILKEEKKISLENIVKILKEDEDENISTTQETIFELTGKLSKSYLLRDNERIIDSAKDKIVVANSNSDKDALFKRLLRYDILCRIVQPKKDVEKIQNMIQKSLDNLN